MKKNKTTIGDLINPEVKNILKKYKRLVFLTEQMGIEKEKSQDLIYLKDLNEPKTHKHYTEMKNLVNKLLKTQKK
tara:strand:+ start:2271 stop:2495 length:225 start_codon:yes stop_codon:yes gene_type:complete